VRNIGDDHAETVLDEFDSCLVVIAIFCSKALYYPKWTFLIGHGGEKEKMNQDDAYSLARAILLIGGIVAIAFGATTLGANISSHTTLQAALADYTPLLGVIVGVVALVASSRIKDEAIAIVMAVLGFLAGGLGGVLVAIGGIWAIISRYTLKAQ
jgi:cytochrome bd-type quinol oxidase subunit 2